MKVTLESTPKIVTLEIGGCGVPARVWQGETANGVPCHAFIAVIQHREDADAEEFERDLQRQAVETDEVAGLPLRYFLD